MRGPLDLQALRVSLDPPVCKDLQEWLEIQETGVPLGEMVSQGLMVCQDPLVPC